MTPRVVLYDGVCGLCDQFVQFVLRRDAGDRFRFAPLQGPTAAAVLRRHGGSPETLDTIYLVTDLGGPGERLAARSTAVLEVLRGLGGGWALAGLLLAVPRVVRDAVYRAVARRRLRWFGRLDACPVPRPEWRRRFLE